MNKIVIALFCCIFLFAHTTPVLHAQSLDVKNLGFENGNFNNWIGRSWVYSTDEPQWSTSPSEGFAYRRHTIMTDNAAYDANTGYALKIIPPGYRYSAKLGDALISGVDVGFRCWQQSLRYSLKIDSTNALLIMRFACVLQYVSSHTEPEEPRFRLTLYDRFENIIPDCSNYDVHATNSYVKGFNTYLPANSTKPVKWRDWTTVGADLTHYIGQTITIEFMSADCTGHLHYGYAYFVAECQPLNINIKYCAGDSVATLTAPEGFESYSWTDNNGNIVDSKRKIDVLRPADNDAYKCTMTSVTGCVVPVQTTIAKYLPKADFTSRMIECNTDTNIVEFTNLSTATKGNLEYIWDFGDGKFSNTKDPVHSFPTSGLHTMSLVVINPPSYCGDEMKKIVESFSPPLVGITGDTTYCPNLTTTIKAYGAYAYDWSNLSKADSLTIGSPGGRYWLIGRSSTGCKSDTIYRTIAEEPEWPFESIADTTLCTGDSVTLKVTGANRYKWNNNSTTNSITVNKPDKYSVVGTNINGCVKSKTFNVLEYPIPKADFSTSTNMLDKKANQIYCFTEPETDVNYEWDMGDGTTETGPAISHEYTIDYKNLKYVIKQVASSIYGCLDSTSKVIGVTPFVPNVFSPNGDGINDEFMYGFDLQIFDRNGLRLYDGSNGWDGKYNDKLVAPDTYFYVIRYIDKDEQAHLVKGYVTLVK